MSVRVRILWAVSVLVLMPFAMALFVGIGGLDAMSHVAATYFCDPGLRRCNAAVVAFVDFWVAWWWAIVIGLAVAGQIAVALCAMFDAALPVWQRLCWLAGLLLVGVLAAPACCILRLRQQGKPRTHASA